MVKRRWSVGQRGTDRGGGQRGTDRGERTEEENGQGGTEVSCRSDRGEQTEGNGLNVGRWSDRGEWTEGLDREERNKRVEELGEDGMDEDGMEGKV